MKSRAKVIPHGGRGFTLVEMVVVMIIIAIVSAVAVPIYRSQARKSKTSEATNVLGAIRQAEKNYYAEHNAFLAVTAGNLANSPTVASPGLGLDYSKNTYFDGNCFSVATDATYQFIASCDGSAAANAAPHSGDVTAYRIQMRGTGPARYSYDSGASWTTWQ